MDAYRQLYRQASNTAGAQRFLWERLNHNQSAIFLAIHDAAPDRLHAAVSELLLRGYGAEVLNDLFVEAEAGRRGAGSAWLDAAAREANALFASLH